MKVTGNLELAHGMIVKLRRDNNSTLLFSNLHRVSMDKKKKGVLRINQRILLNQKYIDETKVQSCFAISIDPCKSRAHLKIPRDNPRSSMRETPSLPTQLCL